MIINSRNLLPKIKIKVRNINFGFARCFGTETAKKEKKRGYVAKLLDEGYKPNIVEKSKYDAWESDKRFIFNHEFSNRSGDIKDEKIFSMVMPPPNVTGNLHLGHALTTTLQDIIARWKRMSGYKVMYLPGTDHAGIATQVVVEKYLQKKGMKKHDLGLEEFNKEVWKWKDRHSSNIKRQLKRLGASLDWSREVFTMDDNLTNAVKYAFIKLYNDKYIYQDTKLINWSCALMSTISDMEIDKVAVDKPTKIKVPGYKQPVEFGYVTSIAYKLSGSVKDEVVVATTRPETILGDVAIGVNPSDERYKHFIGKNVLHPLIADKELPIIADERVDPLFGTGAVKLTPAHDKADYDIAKTHKLPLVIIIDEGGNIIGHSKYSGMPRYTARKKILEDLNKLGCVRSNLPHSMVIPVCSRSGDVVEFLPRLQWFLKCDKLAKDLKNTTDRGELKIVPDHHLTVWNDWLDNHQDWCISRQLWWGHRIPAWSVHRKEQPEKSFYVTAMNEDMAKKLAIEKYDANVDDHNIMCIPDSDVLDTWFSSGLYPFSSLGWPNEDSNDYKYLFPLSVMVTGYDIMCLWVMRMEMLGKTLTGKLPFDQVLLHGIITDPYGAKMSKSKGNVIYPEDVINGASLEELNDKCKNLYELGTLTEKELKLAIEGNLKNYPNGLPECGADALRFTLCEVNPKNQLIAFNISKCYTNKLFGNKMWQSVKYFRNCHDICVANGSIDRCTKNDLQPIDLWLLSRLSDLTNTVTNSLENYDFHIAVAALKEFLYNEMCDMYIECTKQTLRSELTDEKIAIRLASHCHVFDLCFNTALRCLAPFMPYLTEELISAIPYTKNVIHEDWEDTLDNLSFPNSKNYVIWKNETAENVVEQAMNVIYLIRNLRHTFAIDNKTQPSVHIQTQEKFVEEAINIHRDQILFITKCKYIQLKSEDCKSPVNVWSFHHKGNFKLHLELPQTEEMIKKITSATEKLSKKREKLLKNLGKLEKLMKEDKYIKSTSRETKDNNLLKIKEIKDDLDKIEYFRNFSVN